MKKTLGIVPIMVVVLGAVVLLTGTPQILAQTGGATQGTRIAVVNVGEVFTKYKKAEDFKKEIEASLKPMRDQADKVKKDMEDYTKYTQTKEFLALTADKQEPYTKHIRELKRKLEDLDLTARKLVGEKQEKQLVQLWAEVADGVKTVATNNGFQLVLGYGDPADLKLLNDFPNISRKMNAMDMGGALPLFAADSVNLTNGVIDHLNRAVGAPGISTGIQKK